MIIIFLYIVFWVLFITGIIKIVKWAFKPTKLPKDPAARKKKISEIEQGLFYVE